MTIESKLGVFARLEEARAALINAIGERAPADYAEQRMYGEGGWKAREMLSHLAGLDEVAAGDMARVKAGGTPLLSTWKAEDADTWNAFFANTRANCPELQVLEELFSQRYRFMAELATVPDAQFEEGNFVRILGDLVAGHDAHHAAELKAAFA